MIKTFRILSEIESITGGMMENPIISNEARDFKVLRNLDKSEEPSAWTDSYLVLTPEGERAVLTFLNRDRIQTKHNLDIRADQAADVEEEDDLVGKGVLFYEKKAEQFRQNAELAKNVKHPNIAMVYEIGFDKNRNEHYIIREFVPGLPINKATIGLTPMQMLPIFIPILEALFFLHSSKGVLHLNIKPNRIRVASNEDGTYTVKLTDCGYALPIDKEKRGNQLAGTPGYMAREVALKQHDLVGVASDLQSFGILMYYCVTKNLPTAARRTAGGNQDKLASLVSSENLPIAPSAINNACPPALDTIILNLLQREPEDRVYKSALELIQAIKKEFSKECQEQAVMERTISISR